MIIPKGHSRVHSSALLDNGVSWPHSWRHTLTSEVWNEVGTWVFGITHTCSICMGTCVFRGDCEHHEGLGTFNGTTKDASRGFDLPWSAISNISPPSVDVDRTILHQEPLGDQFIPVVQSADMNCAQECSTDQILLRCLGHGVILNLGVGLVGARQSTGDHCPGLSCTTQGCAFHSSVIPAPAMVSLHRTPRAGPSFVSP